MQVKTGYNLDLEKKVNSIAKDQFIVAILHI